MYASSVGLIMRGIDYLETYKKSFNAAPQDDFEEKPADVLEPAEVMEDNQAETGREQKTTLSEKIKIIMQKMFEVEDNSIN
jgi:hypothetical protein